MTSEAKLANEAWEALFRAQVVLMRSFAADDIWDEVSQHEYDVLYALSKSERGLSMVEVNRNILMTQAGVSRLIARLQSAGLIERCADASDARASQLTLTAEGRRVQRSIGRRHAAAVTSAMTGALSFEQLEQLRGLAQQLTAAAEPQTQRTSKKVSA